MKREIVRNKFNGLCAYTGNALDEKWQVDHVLPKYRFEILSKDGANDLENLLPCIAIVNHYKRGYDLEQFREYMNTFHLRLAKLPKKTKLPKTLKRVEYMNKIANLFGITKETPFDGMFYFEKM